jgi:cytochrome c-type biogenesis protein CcmH
MLWLLFGLLTVLVLALLLWPLLRPPAATAGRRALMLAVYRRQLAELQDEAARGLIGESARAEAQREIERRLLAADAVEEAAPESHRSWRRGTAVALLLALPWLALILYLEKGAPTVPAVPWAARQQAAPATDDGDMVALVSQLAERMRRNPDDPRGWGLLGRSYLQLGRYAEAAEAFQRLLALAPEDVDARLDLGEAMTFAASGQVTPLARVAFEAALQRRPDSARARYYMGLVAWQEGEPQVAYDRWLALARTAPAGAPWLPLVTERLRAAAAQLGIDLAAELPIAANPHRADVAAGSRPTEAAPAPTEAAPGPTSADVAAAANMSTDDRQAMIRGMVNRLAARLESTPDDFDGWMRLGRARRVLGEPAAAAEAYARATALRPGDTEPSADHLSALIAAGDLAAAEAAWRELASRLDPAGARHRELSQALAEARAMAKGRPEKKKGAQRAP